MSADPSPADITIQLFTISDTREVENDESGQWMTTRLQDEGYPVDPPRIVREEYDQLQQSFRSAVEDVETDVIISSGGTGISSRDRTIEAVEGLIDKPLPGFGEMFRRLSQEEVGAYTVMSRALAGRADDTILIALPGSPNAVKLAYEEIILTILPHMVKEARK